METFLLKDWKFNYGDLPDSWYKGFDDSSWQDVVVPHDWSITLPLSKSYGSGTGYVAGGTGWYRSSFLLPTELKGKRIYITFDGIYKNSSVWCNSYYIGYRPYGYTTFQYDITDQVSFGDVPNIISVKVEQDEIFDSRWFTGAGIYRKVTLHVTEQVHMEWNGQFITAPEVNQDKASICVYNPLINHTNSTVVVQLQHELYYNQSLIHSFKNEDKIAPNSKLTIQCNTVLSNPLLWSIETPHLYQLKTKIISTNTSDYKNAFDNMNTFDILNTSIGIRSAHFDENKGFFLNGFSTKLKGVCLHHDCGSLGAAVTTDIWLRRLLHLKELGCNAIRMSHNPHMPELYDLCDALGFLVIDEAFDEWEQAKNKWTTGHNVYPPKHQGYYHNFHTWHKEDLISLIRRDRNHPSIILWSIGNEIDYPNDPYCHPLFETMTGNNDADKPSAERMYDPNKPNAYRLVTLCRFLADIVKETDPTRPTTAAVAFPELSTKIGFLDPLDVVGYNYKEDFYMKDHSLFPKKPFLGSENSHSYYAYKMATDLPFIAGQFLWTGIDYLGEAKGWPIHGSYAGLLTTAGFPKVSYYRRKSYWTDRPFIYISTARAGDAIVEDSIEYVFDEWKSMFRHWNYLDSEMIEVRAYTNLPYATLIQNGTTYESKPFDRNKGYICWNIPYHKGELRALGINESFNILVTDFITTAGAPCNIVLKEWSQMALLDAMTNDIDVSICHRNLTMLDEAPYAIIQVEVSITDDAMEHVYSDNSMLYVTVDGAELISIDNGDLSDTQEYTASYRRAYEGRAIIYIRKEPIPKESNSQIIVTVESPYLRTATLII